MDPNVTFRLFIAAIAHGDNDRAAQLADHYAEWRARGGFPAEVDIAQGKAYVLQLDASKPEVALTTNLDDLNIVERRISAWALLYEVQDS
jgi:hypothetical protein